MFGPIETAAEAGGDEECGRKDYGKPVASGSQEETGSDCDRNPRRPGIESVSNEMREADRGSGSRVDEKTGAERRGNLPHPCAQQREPSPEDELSEAEHDEELGDRT